MEWPHWENQLAKAKREGVIEGLLWALGHVDNPKLSYDDILTVIRAEIERLRRGE